MVTISPSLLAADFSRLGEEVTAVKNAGAEWLHLDVMDGLFVPNISFGIPVIQSLRRISDLFFDVHLMIDEPSRYIDAFVKAGADLITVHYEACRDVGATLSSIHAARKKAGLSIKPATPVADIVPYLPLCDLVLIMSVEPGFGGQSFMPESLNKMKELRYAIDAQGLSVLTQIDGGIGAGNAEQVIAAGTDVLVAGSAVFGKPDYAQAVASLRCGK